VTFATTIGRILKTIEPVVTLVAIPSHSTGETDTPLH
jgi:hypothetical protein